jgi:hypothetical protein
VLQGRRWFRHLQQLRALLEFERTGRGRAEWTLAHAARIASMLGLGPSPMSVLERGENCPRCRELERPANLAWQTVVHLDDRYSQRCGGCGGEWVVLL